jgi:hypothetical protein
VGKAGEGKREEEEAGRGAEIREVETSVRPKPGSDKRVTTTFAGLFAPISAPDQTGVFSITEAPFLGGAPRVASA